VANGWRVMTLLRATSKHSGQRQGQQRRGQSRRRRLRQRLQHALLRLQRRRGERSGGRQLGRGEGLLILADFVALLYIGARGAKSRLPPFLLRSALTGTTRIRPARHLLLILLLSKTSSHINRAMSWRELIAYATSFACLACICRTLSSRSSHTLTRRRLHARKRRPIEAARDGSSHPNRPQVSPMPSVLFVYARWLIMHLGTLCKRIFTKLAE
jgi:hypothetical protein